MHIRHALFLTLMIQVILPVLIAGPVVSRREALEAAFPDATFHSQRIFLTEEEKQQAAQFSGVEIPSALIVRYLALQGGREVGRAYIDTHTVRTKKESVLVCLDMQGQAKRVEVTAFLEPREYLASGLWYAQYQGQTLGPELNLHRDIHPIAGATLTALATNKAVRRALALDRVLSEKRERQ